MGTLLPLTRLIVMQRFAASKAGAGRSPNKKRTPRTEFSKKEKRRLRLRGVVGQQAVRAGAFPGELTQQ